MDNDDDEGRGLPGTRALVDPELCSQSNGSNVIQRRARPDQAGLGPHTFGVSGIEVTRDEGVVDLLEDARLVRREVHHAVAATVQTIVNRNSV